MLMWRRMPSCALYRPASRSSLPNVRTTLDSRNTSWATCPTTNAVQITATIVVQTASSPWTWTWTVFVFVYVFVFCMQRENRHFCLAAEDVHRPQHQQAHHLLVRATFSSQSGSTSFHIIRSLALEDGHNGADHP